MSFNLGDKVSFSHWLVKKESRESQVNAVWVKVDDPNPYSKANLRAQIIRRWVPMEFASGTSRTGVVHGIRTLSDGYTQYDYDEGTTFFPVGKYTRAYLVSFSMTQKPIYVLGEHLSLLDSEN